MNKLIYKKLILFLLVFSFTLTICEAQSFDRPKPHKLQKNVRKSPMKSKTIKVREPRSREKAKRKTEVVDRKNKRAYEKYVRDNQKRSLEIQTPVVRERMKKNMKTANANYKAKRKMVASSARKSGKKYSR
jgi:hypothetical protein